jgi:hypothetical protein
MPDTAEGRYWKMSAKERKAWKLTNATPWLSGQILVVESPVVKTPVRAVRVLPVVQSPVETPHKPRWWQRLF